VTARGILLVVVASAALGCRAAPEPAAVVIALRETTPVLSSATVTVDYSNAGAKPYRMGEKPSCAVLAPRLAAEFGDDGRGTMTITLHAPSGFAAPIDLAVCRMVADDPSTAPSAIAARLRVTLAAAVDEAGRVFEGAERPAAASAERNGTADADPSVAELAGGLRERTTGNAQRDVQRLREREREGRTARRLAAAEEAGSTDADVDPLGDQAARAQAGREPQDRSDAHGWQDPQDPQDGQDLPADIEPSDDPADDGEENDPDVRRKTPAYDCYMDVLNDAGPIGTLRFVVRHTGTSGGWEGSSTRVSCTWEVGAERSACSDVGAGRLQCALVDDVGFATPSPVATCTFRSVEALSVQNFDVQVLEARDPDGGPVAIDMSVTAVLPR
jgi:hypothetical protein